MDLRTQKIKAKIVENCLSISKLAKEMQIGRDTLSNKIKNGGEKLNLKEIRFLIKRLKLTDDEILEIFFMEQTEELGFKVQEQDI